MNAQRAAALALFAGTFIACTPEDPNGPASAAGTESAVVTTGTVTPANVAGSKTVNYPIAKAGSTRTTGVDLDIPLAVSALKKLKSTFYGTGQAAFTTKRTPGWNDDEPRQCLQACPAFYSDIVCHFYSWHPSYDQVSPNIRGCFTQIARGQFQTTIGQALVYPQIYDYCTYQPFDAVTNPQNFIPGTQKPMAFDLKLIEANKAAGKRVGVNTWVDTNEAEAFKAIMFTWYDAKLYTLESQEAAINEFYGVDLGKKTDYDTTDAAQIKECKKARRRTAQDNANNVPDGMECSTKKTVTPGAQARHPNFDAIVKFMNSNDPSLK